MYVLLSFYFYACYQKPKIFSLFLGFDQISPGAVSPAATGWFPSRCHTRQVRARLFRDPDQDISTPETLARVDPNQDIRTPKIPVLARVGWWIRKFAILNYLAGAVRVRTF